MRKKETLPFNDGSVGPAILSAGGVKRHDTTGLMRSSTVAILHDIVEDQITMEHSAVQRVAVYIDGMNLFYGLRSKRKGLKGDSWPCYYWLDLHRMSQRLLRDGQVLKKVR